jgi:hypothetical protein
VCDVSNPQSLKNLENWINMYKEYFAKNNKKIPYCALISNKLDLYSALKPDDIDLLIKLNGFKHYLLSAKNGDQIDLIFKRIICEILNIKLPKNLEQIEIQKFMHDSTNKIQNSMANIDTAVEITRKKLETLSSFDEPIDNKFCKLAPVGESNLNREEKIQNKNIDLKIQQDKKKAEPEKKKKSGACLIF